MRKLYTMSSPRWFPLAAALLVLNAGAVITTGVWRHAGAEEPPTPSAADTPSADTSVQPTAAATGSGVSVAGATAGGKGTPSGIRNPVDSIPVPDAMPEIPSLPDAEALQNDPGFQEFRRLFAAEEESWSSEPPPLGKRHLQVRSAVYFASLDQRLATVEKICSATRSIAREAASHAQNGSTEKSDELVRMATQLRDIAAKLLVSEL